MVTQLRKKLIGMYVLATGLLLSLIVAGLLFLSLKQYETNNISKYQSVFGNIADTIKSTDNISYDWLAKSEINNSLMISITSNSIPISYNGTWIPQTNREKLFQKLDYFAERDGFYVRVYQIRQGEVKSPIYSVYGEYGDHYYGSIFQKKTYGKEQKIMVLKTLSDEKKFYRNSIFLYSVIDFAGLIGLFFICRVFVDCSLRPLEEGLKRQNEFIAAASHELRAPLTVIQAGIQAAAADESNAEKYLSVIKNEGNRMGLLINDLLQLALADAKSWTLRKKPLASDTFLISMYDSLAELCRKKNQLFELHLQEEVMPAFYADPQRMEQIIMILTDNACSYSPDGSKITVTVWSAKKHLFIEIEDHGCGIKDEDKKMIFDRFYRSDQSRNDKAHYGLGLSIAAELVRLHHGRLSVKDTTGGGSTFVLEIPIWNPDGCNK